MISLIFFLLFSSSFVNALLSPSHFSSSFLLNLTSPAILPSIPSCGSNLGSDELRLDSTSALPGTDSLPVSPAFYYFGGQRCRRLAPDHAAFFVLHPGLEDDVLDGRLKEVAEAIKDAAGTDSVVTAEGTQLRERRTAKSISFVAIVPTKQGARVKQLSGELSPGPVLCGQRMVSSIVYARSDKDVDVKNGDGNVVLRMSKERMYAIVETEDDVCFYDGFTRAPEGEVELEDFGEMFEEAEADDEGEGGGVNSVALGIGIASIVLLALILAVVFGLLYVRAKRAEKKEEGEVSQDIEAEEQSDEDEMEQPGQK